MVPEVQLERAGGLATSHGVNELKDPEESVQIVWACQTGYRYLT